LQWASCGASHTSVVRARATWHQRLQTPLWDFPCVYACVRRCACRTNLQHRPSWQSRKSPRLRRRSPDSARCGPCFVPHQCRHVRCDASAF
jgi:hypothetical protein